MEQGPRFLLFTGKGGVGKTSLACATAVQLADDGQRVLLVSTDPASNLSDVLGTDVDDQPTPISGVPRLDALNIDPEAAAQAYRDRIVAPVKGKLPEPLVRQMEEELSGACTTEIAAFDEFTELLTDANVTRRYDRIVFDTAPTGHTLRLMKLPAAWSSFIETNRSGASCLGPLAGLEKQREQYQAAFETLIDPGRTRLILVSRPDTSALAEAENTRGELERVGVRNQRLILNGVPPLPTSDDELAIAMRERAQRAIHERPVGLRSLPTDEMPLAADNLVGLDALRRLVTLSDRDDRSTVSSSLPTTDEPPLRQLVDTIAEAGHGLVMVMGKGGVGKTTIAAAVAVELASRGHEVLLTTTDPAAHLAQTIEGELAHLTISRIDPRVETERYRRHVLETQGQGMDEQGRAMLEEDLRSPCTEEIAVFQAFSAAIRDADTKFVVMDTAPTGHTLLLLDATGSYHREILRHAQPGAKLITPLMRLQDPSRTKVLIISLPETTPVHEATQLQADLRRAGIEPWGWVINGSLLAARPMDPLLVRRALNEFELIERVRRQLASRAAVVPWRAQPPIGIEALLQLTADASHASSP